MRPRSTRNDPATALSNVDFPEPFVPMTITNEPSSIVRSTPCKRPHLVGGAGVERLGDVVNLQHGMYASSTTVASFATFVPAAWRRTSGQHERREHEQRGDQLQIVGVQTPAQAIATSKRNRIEPITAPTINSPTCREPTSDSPMITLANPHTTMPMPICTSANP